MNEWSSRGIQEEKDFDILTNEISKVTFGKTVSEYEQFKGLKRPNQNLRDHMNNWELILTMVGEKAMTYITAARNSPGFGELKQSARRGGQIAGIPNKTLSRKLANPLCPKRIIYTSYKIRKRRRQKSNSCFIYSEILSLNELISAEKLLHHNLYIEIAKLRTQNAGKSKEGL